MIKRLIVNADDYGHTAGVSAGIRQAHLQGIVTSTTVMMNRPDAVNGIKLAQKECPRLGMGVHLVITSGSPLLPAERASGLVNDAGQFRKLPDLMAHLDEINLDEVEAEWRAQIQAFIKAAECAPDHLDSHHHSSYFTPALFELMLKLGGELGCHLRVPFGLEETVFQNGEESPFMAELKKNNFGYAQVFCDQFYDEGVTLENLLSILHRIVEDRQHDTFEIMCHPALVDDELRRISIYNERRGAELELLQHPEIISFIKENNIHLIRFSDLP